MNRDQRTVYLELLTDIAPFGLCALCKHGESQGCMSGTKCVHPLSGKSWSFEKMVEGASELGDCWAFRPQYSLSTIADVVGMILSEDWAGFSCWQDGDILRIAGVT